MGKRSKNPQLPTLLHYRNALAFESDHFNLRWLQFPRNVSTDIGDQYAHTRSHYLPEQEKISRSPDFPVTEMLQTTFAQGAESAIVTTRVVVIIAFLHFLGVFITILLPGPLSETSRDVLFRYCPPAVFILSILFNQFGILYFNQVMEHTAFVPIVNTKGDVIGRSLAVDAINKKMNISIR